MRCLPSLSTAVQTPAPVADFLLTTTTTTTTAWLGQFEDTHPRDACWQVGPGLLLSAVGACPAGLTR